MVAVFIILLASCSFQIGYTILYSKSAIAISENHVFHEKTKHIKSDYHLVREKVQKGLLKLLYVPTANQLIDGFTKPLQVPIFWLFHSKLVLVDIYAPAYGGGNKRYCEC